MDREMEHRRDIVPIHLADIRPLISTGSCGAALVLVAHLRGRGHLNHSRMSSATPSMAGGAKSRTTLPTCIRTAGHDGCGRRRDEPDVGGTADSNHNRVADDVQEV